MRNLCLYGAMGALCLSLPAISAAQGIPDIVITPTRFAQSLSSVVVPTDVITHRDIANSGAQTVAGVLRAYAGFDVTSLGGAGQQTSVFMQGTNSNMVLVLINGVRVNQSTSGGVSWSTLPASNIERIEVIKGPLSTLWGSDAIGGVVNIITRQPSGNGGSIQVGGGNHDTRSGALGLHGSDGVSRAGLTLSGVHTGGEPVIQGFSPRAAYDNRNLNAYVSTRLGRLGVHADLWQNRGRQTYVAGTPSGSAYELRTQDYLQQTSSVRLTLPLRTPWHMAGRFARTRNHLLQGQADTYVIPLANDYAVSTRNLVEAQLGYTGGGAHVLFGASQATTHARSLSYGTRYDGYRTARAGFAEWRQYLHGVEVLGAARRTVDSQYGGHNTWNLAMALPLPNDARFKLSTGTGYHAPTFNDLYGFGGNPSLSPETSRSEEAQLIIPAASAGVFTLTAYRHRLRNLIDTVLVDPATYTYRNVNVGNARVRGLDLAWSLRSGPWSFALEGGWVDPRNLDSGKPLLRRASHHYRVRLGWQRERWRAAATWTYEGARASSVSGETLAPYRLVNLSLHYAIDRHWSTALRLDNALDTAYTPAYYVRDVAYLGPRRSVHMSLKYAFGAV